VKLSSGSITTGRTSGLLTLAIGALFYSSGSIARPDLQPLGPNIADKGSAFYHFTQRQYDSADGERHYRVWTFAIGRVDRSAGQSPARRRLSGTVYVGWQRGDG